jgi:para-nitrobenzyl esterase
MWRATACLAALGFAGCAQAPPSVTVDGEVLVGSHVAGGVAAFLGVPFAEPPVGDLRWRAPQPLATKLQRRDTTRFAPACMQTTRILDWYRYLAETFGGSREYYPDLEISEDCLYLNVWTPTPDTDAKLPVMVWVYGGSNRSGWSYEPNYHGHVLAARDVVVISVAYRQGLFGFLSHPELPAGEAQANFGLWDIVAALRWVQRNAAAFGGDPDRVTLFGESAGAQNILALMFADAADGLFQRAVLQSTASFGIERMSTLADEQRRGTALAKALGLGGGDELAKLRALPAARLLEPYETDWADYYHAPAIDDMLLTENTWQRIRSGDFRGRRLIIGTNRDEWLDYIERDAGETELREAAAKLLHFEPEAALALVADEPDPRRAMDRLITADNYLCASQITASRASESGGNAWMYYFTRVREDAGGRILGAYHGAEYPYVFGTHDAYMRSTDIDHELTDIMQRYWVNFAAVGDPNGPGLPPWPVYAQPDARVQELGDSVGPVPPPDEELCRLFDAG